MDLSTDSSISQIIPPSSIDLEKLRLGSGWKEALGAEFSKPYMQTLSTFLKTERLNKNIFPAKENVLRALELTPLESVRVVILGQDPYHGLGQAHGLSFSVRPGVPLPPSLKNIYTELREDLGISTPKHGFLETWAKEGVLLLNAVLTVEEGLAASHRGKGWEHFTDKIVSVLNEEKTGLAFILWGNDAKKKGAKIDRLKHLVIESGHPSPLSIRYFRGSKPFSKVNDYFFKTQRPSIDWSLPPEV